MTFASVYILKTTDDSSELGATVVVMVLLSGAVYLATHLSLAIRPSLP